ncbi:MAG TPA: DUF1800 domain-containing protein, partial [Chroococcales cyanobacterium]
ASATGNPGFNQGNDPEQMQDLAERIRRARAKRARKFQDSAEQAGAPPAAPSQTADASTANGDTPAQKSKNKELKLKGIYYRQIYESVAEAKLMRAIESPRQLQEVMTDFWFNHFNIFANKGLDHLWIGAYEEQAIRPYALGNFRDLLGATCHHAGMLFYLDNWQNSAPGTRRGKKEIGLNENYARELMELHTLGVDGGYTQQDVIQLAHVLTGLGLPPQRGRRNAWGVPAPNDFGSYFDQRRHDQGDKVILGQTIHGSGPAEIEQALDILAASPATAHHLSYQLAQYFVADDPPKSLVDKLACTYSSSHGNIKAMLNTLFHSSEFWDPQYAEAKYKSPLRYVVSSLRAVDARPENYRVLIQYLKQQGQPLYGCLTPDGYKNTREAWLNPGGLLHRIDFATQLASGRMRGVTPQVTDPKQVERSTGDVFSDKTMTAIARAPEKLRSALVLGSPEFMLY